MNELDRRTFLGAAAAVPILYGLEAFQADPSKGADAPAWLDQALARMKETGRWGVVLMLPEAPQPRFKLGQALWAIAAFENEDFDAHRLLCEAVFVVVLPELARRRFEAKEGITRILLSPEGRPIVSDKEPLTVVGDGVAFAASFGRFIHGEGNERLVERADALEQAMAPEVKAAFAKLGSDTDEDRLLAARVLVRKVEAIAPCLVRLAETSDVPRRRQQAKNLLSSYFGSLKPDAAGAKIPYGCSGPHHYDPCRTCGMAMIPERSRMFVRFLVPGAPPEKKDGE